MNLNITLDQPDKKLALFGTADRHLRMIRDTFGVQLTSRDDELRLAGEREQVAKAAAVLEQMQRKLRRQDWLSVEDVGQAIGRAAEQHEARSPMKSTFTPRATRFGPRLKAKSGMWRRFSTTT